MMHEITIKQLFLVLKYQKKEPEKKKEPEPAKKEPEPQKGMLRILRVNLVL